MTCIGCKVTSYCGRDHQKDDWQLHKHFCKSFESFEDQHRPSQDHRRAILLPEEKAKPRFIWVPPYQSSTDQQEDPDEPYARLDFTDFIDDGPNSTQTSLVILGDYTSEVGKNLDQAVYLACRSTNQFDGSQPNKCLVSLCADGRVARRYKGPIVLFGMDSKINQRLPLDIAAVDFSLALKVLLEHHFKSMWAEPQKEAAGVVVLNSRVADARQVSPFGDVFVPLEQPIFKDGKKSALSKLIGMPLLTFECLAEEDQKDGDKVDEKLEESDQWETSPAAFLHLNVEANGDAATDPTFGTIPDEWSKRKGSILVVREDLQPLSASMVHALCKYAAQEAKSLLMHATESSDSRRKAVTNISKADWEEFLEEHELADGVKKL
ncbi:hypothetical protein PRZ48_004204 [Zasmidium cellare]|uniref:MYND-type domain-containing protein n=1 Tax=Zasmidium cellare TaxID=395010 RepID=A0ABR0EX66_ZASCE|nr:hypothetical protein PRZ48_004204 [Zasmidium cellare]